MKLHTSCAIASVALSLLGACHGNRAAGGSDAPTPSASGSVSPATGVDAAGNDPAVVALAKDVLACHWGPKAGYPDGACPAWKAWNDANDVRDKAPAATYVNMLEDPNPVAHILAIGELALGAKSRGPDAWGTDPALARRVLAAAKVANADHGHLDAYSVALDHIDYAKTGLWPETRAFLDATPLKYLRIWVMGNLVREVPSNAANDEVWGWLAAKVADPDKEVARGALQGFAQVTSRKGDACKIFDKALADDRLVGSAVLWIAEPGNECEAFGPEALAAAESKLAGKGPIEGQYSQSLKWLAEDAKAPEAQKKRALAALEAYASLPRVAGAERAAALRSLYAVDAPRGLALAEKLTKDKDRDVVKAAKEVAAKGTSPKPGASPVAR